MKRPLEWHCNAAFGDLLAQRPAERTLPDEIAAIVHSGFTESGGCLYSRALRDQDVDHDRVEDRTGLEALVNHFHVDGDSTTQDDFWTALTAGETLARELAEWQGSGRVRVIVSRNDRPHVNSVVRFIRLRPDEPWLDGDLESYPEPVGYLDVDSG